MSQLRERSSSAIGLAAAVLVAMLPAAPVLQGQTPSFRVETRVVEVPVVVRDKKTGRAVEGLKAEDFVLLEAGKRQKIEFFSVHRVDASVQSAAKTAARGAARPRVFRNRRGEDGEATPVVAVLIDGFNARFEDQYYAAQAAAKVIEARERRALWSIYFLGRRGLRVIHDYSTDTESVVERLRRLKAAGDAVEGLGAEAGDWRPYGPGEFDLRATSNFRRSEEELRARITLGALGDIGRHLSALPGRKSLVWLTTGLSLSSIVDPMKLSLSDMWHHTLDTLNDANVAVYSIDSEGVRTARGYRAEVGASRTVNIKGGLGSPIGDMQIMAALADETGGRWFANSNDLVKGVDESLADSQVFYRLAYRASRAKWDGGKVDLEVKVLGRKDIEIRHRRSYIARAIEPLGEKARDRVLADAIISPLEAVEIGVTARLTPIEGSEESMLRLTLDPGSVTLAESGGRYVGRMDIRWVQATVESKVIDDSTDEVNLNLALAEAERTYGEGFNYQKRLRIQPDTQTLKIAFCDYVTGRVGSLRVEILGRAGAGTAP
jgi:VWFA-related protein